MLKIQRESRLSYSTIFGALIQTQQNKQSTQRLNWIGRISIPSCSEFLEQMVGCYSIGESSHTSSMTDYFPRRSQEVLGNTPAWGSLCLTKAMFMLLQWKSSANFLKRSSCLQNRSVYLYQSFLNHTSVTNQKKLSNFTIKSTRHFEFGRVGHSGQIWQNCMLVCWSNLYAKTCAMKTLIWSSGTIFLKREPP